MDLLHQMESIVGADNVSDKPFVRWAYSRDASVVEGNVPGLVVMPKTIEEIQAIMKLANETKTPVFPRGSGTSLWGAVPVKGAIVIDTAKMIEVKKIDEEVLTCVIQPGITFGELDAVLNKKGYRFLVAPENALSGTVGGHFASHGSGTGSTIYGLQGDCVLGLKVVLPNGELLTTGSGLHPHLPRHYARYVFANDLTGLFCGSEGTLGTIVEVALKIEKVPEAMEFAVFKFDSFASAIEAGTKVRRARIPTLKMDLRGPKMLDAIDPKGKPHEPAVIVFAIEGDKDVVGIYKNKLVGIVEKYGEYMGDAAGKARWANRWRVSAAPLTLGVRIHFPVILPGGKDTIAFLDTMEKVCDELEERYKLINVSMAGGFGAERGWLIGANIIYDESDPLQWQRAKQAAEEFQDKAYHMGACPYRIGTYWTKYMQQLGPYFDVLKKIKETLDPNHIMSPGVLGL
jgi:glycolate oxidase